MSHSRRPILILLFITFLRLGATSFGGPAMVAYIRRMVVEQKGWLDDETFRAGVALCQVIPGATAIQMAAYVGLRTQGVTGAAVTYIGFALPAFLIIMFLSALYFRTYNFPIAVSLFSGLQAIIVAMVANAAISFGISYLKLWRDFAVAFFAAGMFIFGTSPFLVILLAAFIGFIIYKDQPIQHRPIAPTETPRTTIPLLLILSAVAIGFILLFLLQRDLFDMAALMFRIDLFAFGGGFAALPLMLHEVVDVRSWMDYQTFMNGIVLGQITPGPIVITAAFVGYMMYGPIGGIVATLGIFLPSFLLVIGTVPYYDRLSSSPGFNRAVNGILCSFVGLLASVTFHFATNMQWDISHAAIAVVAFIALIFKVDILWVILIGAIISVLLL
ncbi:MAG: chromate efflux transporter [Methanotrichaceae archaeon]|nr:chromate efflux transporter [Methanotrichaceae archaeon]